MYARVACATGWTWEYIGERLTLPRLYALQRYWKESPPVNETVAAFLLDRGAKRDAPAKPATVEQSPEAIAALMQSLPMLRVERPA